MQIYYCEGCGLRISNDEVASEAVVKHDEKVYCQRCAVAKGLKPNTHKSRSVIEPARRSAPAATPDRGNRTPAAAHASAAPQSAAVRAKKTPRQSMNAGLMIGGAVAVLVVVIIFMGRSKDTSVASTDNSEKATTEEPRPNASQPAAPINPPKTATPPPRAAPILETPKSDPMVRAPATKVTSPPPPKTVDKPAPLKTPPPGTSAPATGAQWPNTPYDMHAGPLLSVACSPDGKWMAIGALDHAVRLINNDTKKVTKLDGHTERVSSVAFSPDGKWLGSGGWDNLARLWNVEERKLVYTLKGHTNKVWGVSFSPDSGTLASGSFDKSVRLWDTASGNEKKFDPKVSEVLALNFASTEKLLATVGTGLTVRVWEMGDEPISRAAIRVTGVALATAFSPNGKLLAVGFESEKTVGVWDLNGKLQCMLSGHKDYVTSVCFLNDKTLVSCSKDKLIKVWDLGGAREIVTLTAHTDVVTGVALIPNRKMLCSVSNDGKLCVWNFEDIALP